MDDPEDGRFYRTNAELNLPDDVAEPKAAISCPSINPGSLKSLHMCDFETTDGHISK